MRLSQRRDQVTARRVNRLPDDELDPFHVILVAIFDWWSAGVPHVIEVVTEEEQAMTVVIAGLHGGVVHCRLAIVAGLECAGVSDIVTRIEGSIEIDRHYLVRLERGSW